MLQTHFTAKKTYRGIHAVFLFLEPKFGCHYINCLGDTNTAMTVMIPAVREGYMQNVRSRREWVITDWICSLVETGEFMARILTSALHSL